MQANLGFIGSEKNNATIISLTQLHLFFWENLESISVLGYLMVNDITGSEAKIFDLWYTKLNFDPEYYKNLVFILIFCLQNNLINFHWFENSLLHFISQNSMPSELVYTLPLELIPSWCHTRCVVGFTVLYGNKAHT